jgi:geranylgeranyl diphosphate synthase type I
MACEAAGGNWRMALPAAAAIELIHNFSLIHDDIEYNSTYRRHRPTLWHIWGQPMAINAGDAMHTLGEQTMLGLLEKGIESQKVLECLSVLNETCLRLCEGQHLDLSYEKRLDINVKDYLKMVKDKTAAMFECAFRIGVYLGTQNRAIVKRFQACGQDLGMAFQMTDDTLGIWGSDKVTGKSSGSDLEKKKKTLPVVYALRHAKGPEKEVLLNFYQQEKIEPA